MELNTIPYKGTGPAMNDLLGGQANLLCDQTTQTVPMIKDDRVKVFGLTTLKGPVVLQDVPMLDEQDLKGFEVKVWHGVYTDKGTPALVLEKINATLRVAMQDPMVKQRLDEMSSNITPLDEISPVGLKPALKLKS